MSKFAIGRHALGMCDRCGQQYKLSELKSEVVNLEVTSFRVCPECWDPDNPQTQLGRYYFSDPQALRDPRPPQSLDASRYGGAIRYDFTDSAEGFSLELLTGIPSYPVMTVGTTITNVGSGATTLATNARGAGTTNVYVTKDSGINFPAGSVLSIPLTDSSIFKPTVTSVIVSGSIDYDWLNLSTGFPSVGSDGTYGTVSHDADAGTIVSKPDDTSAGRTLNGIVSPTVSVRTADIVDGVRVPSYVYVRVRVRISESVDGSTPLPVPSPNSSYGGKMYWRTSSGAYSLSASSVSSPDWNQMGEPYQVLTWDMSDNEDWLGSSGTVVTGLYWIFFTGLTKSGEYEIDYVRFEKSASQTE